MARDATIRTVLTASDQASGPLKNFQNTLRGVQSDMGGVNQMAGLLKGGIAGMAAAAGVDALMELGGAVMDLGRAGEQALILRDAFEQTAGGVGASSTAMLTSLKEASGGMIADQELMLAANRAMMLGVADSSEEMGKLLEVAAVRGRAMGLSTSQAFNDLVTGLGRMSPMILDNLGIVTGGEAVFTAYAASIGKTADALTDAERKQALFNKVVASTDTSGEVIVSQFERMDAAIQNAKGALGELFGPAIAQIAQNLADSVTEITDAITTDEIEAAQNRLWGFGETITLLAQKIQPLKGLSIAAETTGDTAQLQQLQQELANTSTMLGVYVANYNEAATITGAPLIDPVAIQQGEIAYLSAAEAAALLGQQQTDAAQSGRVLADIERQVAESAGLLQGAVSRAAAAVDTIRGKFVQAAAAGMAASTAFANFSQFKGLETQAEQIRSGLGNLGFYEPEDIEFYVDLNTERALMSADEMIQAFEDINTAAGGAAGGGVNDLQKGLDSLQGKALGAVQAATTLDPVGVDPADFLPREDAVQENAFRLAAIMKEGLIGQPWLEEFKREVPDVFQELVDSGDVQGKAAQILSQFQMGLRPELLDLGAIKEKIKNEIAGESAMQATAMQITAELVAETNGDFDTIQRQVEQALGLSGQQIAVEALITPNTSALGDIPPVAGTVTLSPDLAALTGLHPEIAGVVAFAPDLTALTELSPEVQARAIFEADLTALAGLEPALNGIVHFDVDLSGLDGLQPTVTGRAVFIPELVDVPSPEPVDVALQWLISPLELPAIADQAVNINWIALPFEAPTIAPVPVDIVWNVIAPELPAISEQIIPVDWSVPPLELTQPAPVDVAVQWQFDAPELPTMESPIVGVNWTIPQPELPTLTAPPIDVDWNISAPEIAAISDQIIHASWLIDQPELPAIDDVAVDVDWNVATPELPAIPEQVIPVGWNVAALDAPVIPEQTINTRWEISTPELPTITVPLIANLFDIPAPAPVQVDLQTAPLQITPPPAVPVELLVQPLEIALPPAINVELQAAPLEITQPPPIDVAVQWQFDAPELPTLTAPPIDVTWNVAALDLPVIADQTARVDWLVAPLELTAPPPLVVDVTVEANDIQERVATALGLGVKGAQLSDSILGELSSATFAARLNTVAGGAGRGWGDAFLAMVEQNVPPQLVALLVSLVTPGVAANIATQTSLTEPVP